VTIVVCPYCGRNAELVPYDSVKPGWSGSCYLCRPCQAWVGVHGPGTSLADKPLGTLANAELRKARQAVHTPFDRLWRRGAMTRTEAYRWLAQRMSLPAWACHIAMFDLAQCQEALSTLATLEREKGRQAVKPPPLEFSNKLPL